MKNNYFLSFFLSLFWIGFLAGQEAEPGVSNLIKEIKTFNVLKKYDKAIELSKEIIKKRIDKSKLGKDYYRLGFYFKKNNQIDSAYYFYIKSSQVYLNLQDTLNIAKQLLNISSIESQQGLYNKSDSSALSSLRYINKKNNLFDIAYNCLGINSREKGEYEEALKWYGLAVKTASDSIKKLRYINNQTNVFVNLENYKEAISNYLKIKNNKYYDSIPLNLKAIVLDNEAFVRFLDNQDVKEADFLEAQRIKKVAKYNLGLIANYSNLSDFFKLKNKVKSLEYAYKMYTLSKEMNLSVDRVEALDRIISLEDKIKIRRLAKERNRLSDSLQLTRQQSQNKFAKIIYNYEEVEKQKLKVQVALEKEKTKTLLIVFICISLCTLFLIYVFYRNQQIKKEKIIEIYKTETRLAKKIHDELANDVYMLMDKAQDTTNDILTLLPGLEKIYALTRDISHENSVVVTGDGFEDYLEQMLVEFSKSDCKVLTKGLTNIVINDLVKEKQIVIYRVIQELLVNMKKHSNATLVIISFSEDKNIISIKYKDNGEGVDKLNIKNGMQNMDTRIKSIKGLFKFESEYGKGFNANIQFKR